MKKFGFFLALIAVLTMGTTAFAANGSFDVKSWDISLGGNISVDKTGTIVPNSVVVSYEPTRTYVVTLKSGDTFTLSGDAKWWTVSNDNKASFDATVSIDTYVTSKDSTTVLGTYFAVVESKDFSPKVSGKIPSFKLKALSHDATLKVFEITLTPNLSEDISGDIISKDVNASRDMAVTFKFTISAVPVSGDVPPVSPDVSPDVKPEPAKPVTKASADVYAKEAGFTTEVIDGNSYPVVKPTEMQLPVKSMDQNKSLVFPFVTVTISSDASAANLQISTNLNDKKKAIAAASFDVDPKKEAGYKLYKLGVDGKVHALTKVAGYPKQEGQYSIENGSLIVFVKDYIQQPGAAKTYDFDGTKGVIVDPLYAAYINKEGTRGGSSSSGCSAGYAPFALLFAAPLFFFRKK